MGLFKSLYGYADLDDLQQNAPEASHTQRMTSIGDLLDRDLQREKDGFPRKIRIGRLIKPGRGAKERIVVVPTTIEEKFIHDSREQTPDDEDGQSGGSGDGQEGDVIAEGAPSWRRRGR